MNIGDKILELRKSKGYSQEDIANKLSVSRQTVSKWETNQSTPDFDKIVPLCELFEITTDELLRGVKTKKSSDTNVNESLEVSKQEYKIRRKYALSLCISIFLFFASIMWVIFADGMGIDDSILVVVFLGIVALATVIIIYSSIVNKQRKKIAKEKEENSKVNKINDVLALLFLVIYLAVSFLTMAWYITWIIWVVYALCTKIVELAFKLEESKNE